MISFIALITGDFFREDFKIQGTELTNYQGQELSSIYDFRENSIKGYQYVPKDSYELRISGLVNTPKNYSYNEVITNYKTYEKVVTLFCVEGWEVKILWEGVLVKDLIDITNIEKDANTIIFHGYDGYTTSFPIEYIIDNEIVLAYKMNNITITPERGFPFQLVAESKWGYKWIKWVTEIEISDDENYKGFWERRGYSNDGDLDKSFFG